MPSVADFMEKSRKRLIFLLPHSGRNPFNSGANPFGRLRKTEHGVTLIAPVCSFKKMKKVVFFLHTTKTICNFAKNKVELYFCQTTSYYYV